MTDFIARLLMIVVWAAICLALGAGLLAAGKWLKQSKIRKTNPPLWIVIAVVVLLPLAVLFVGFANLLVTAIMYW